MIDDKKIIFSMVNVSKTYPPQKQVYANPVKNKLRIND